MIIEIKGRAIIIGRKTEKGMMKTAVEHACLTLALLRHGIEKEKMKELINCAIEEYEQFEKEEK